MRFPLCDDAAAVLSEIEEEVKESKEPRVSLLYDISRAHKLIPVLERDWGLQAFKLPGSPDGQIYVHTRGTFGVASAAYYWQRVAAGMIRVIHRLSGKELGVYHLLFADDGWLTSVGWQYWRKPLFWLFVMELLEFPVSWKKVRGGVEVQWIGYQINVGNFTRGISDKKVAWVKEWIQRKKQDGGATGREMRSSLGRLSFVAGALHHVRPLLGPIFAWASMLSSGTFAQFPDAVKILLGYISKQLDGCSMEPAKRMEAEPTDVFRIDARAEGDKIVVGGWESYMNQDTSQARWFSIELNRRNAAWAYVKGDPFIGGGANGGHVVCTGGSLEEWKDQGHHYRHYRQFGKHVRDAEVCVLQVPLVDSGDGAGVSVEEAWSGDGPCVGTQDAKCSCRCSNQWGVRAV